MISVITVCRNAAATLEKTIQSVRWQDYEAYEHLIVDGMSTDGTVALLAGYADPRLKVIREPDTGIYNAMNKGVSRCRGEVLVFLNADDYFASPYVLARVAQTFAAHPEVDLVYGDYIIDSGTEQAAYSQPAHLDRRFFVLDQTILHQTLFVRRRAFDGVGPFDETLLIAADRDWLIRALFQAQLRPRHVALVICVFYGGGYSGTAKAELAAERAVIRRRYLSPAERFCYAVYVLQRRLRRRLERRDFSLPAGLRQIRGGKPGHG